MSEANPDIGFVIYDVTEFDPDATQRDIAADPPEGISPLPVQFRDIEAQEE